MKVVRGSTMVTTPRFDLEPRDDAGLREEGRSLWPEKSEVTLVPAKGERKLVEREALRGEQDDVVWMRLGFRARAVVGGANMRV